MKQTGLMLVFMALLSGCAKDVQKDYVATGGSKADGVIELSYEYTEYERPTANEEQGLELAVKRCKSWGYNSAEIFGGGLRTCIVSPGDWVSCGVWRISKNYQCLDAEVKKTISDTR